MPKYIYLSGAPVDPSLPITKERDGRQWVQDVSGGWTEVIEQVQRFDLVSPAVQAIGAPVMDRLASIEAKLDQLLAKS